MRLFIVMLSQILGISPEDILSRVDYHFENSYAAESFDMSGVIIPLGRCAILTDVRGGVFGENVWFTLTSEVNLQVVEGVRFVINQYERGEDYVGFSIFLPDGEEYVDGALIEYNHLTRRYEINM